MRYTSYQANLHIDEEGICNACRSYEKRKVDWEKSAGKELLVLLDKYRRNMDLIGIALFL